MCSDNYPDDVRQYDNNPNSPFYNDLHEEQDEEKCECGADLVSVDEIFSEECDACFAKGVLEDPRTDELNQG